MRAAHSLSLRLRTMTMLASIARCRNGMISRYSGESYHCCARPIDGNSTSTVRTYGHVPARVSWCASIATHHPSYFCSIGRTLSAYSANAPWSRISLIVTTRYAIWPRPPKPVLIHCGRRRRTSKSKLLQHDLRADYCNRHYAHRPWKSYSDSSFAGDFPLRIHIAPLLSLRSAYPTTQLNPDQSSFVVVVGARGAVSGGVWSLRWGAWVRGEGKGRDGICTPANSDTRFRLDCPNRDENIRVGDLNAITISMRSKVVRCRLRE